MTFIEAALEQLSHMTREHLLSLLRYRLVIFEHLDVKVDLGLSKPDILVVVSGYLPNYGTVSISEKIEQHDLAENKAAAFQSLCDRVVKVFTSRLSEEQRELNARLEYDFAGTDRAFADAEEAVK